MLPQIMFHITPSIGNLQFANLPDRCTEDAIYTLIHHLINTWIKILTLPGVCSETTHLQPNIFLDKLYQYKVPARLQ